MFVSSDFQFNITKKATFENIENWTFIQNWPTENIDETMSLWVVLFSKRTYFFIN